MAYNTLQDVIDIIMPEEAMHHLTWSHGKADVDKTEADMTQQLALPVIKNKSKG